MEKTTPFDAAEWLTSEEAIAIFLNDAEATKDKEYIENARQVAKRAKQKNAAK